MYIGVTPWSAFEAYNKIFKAIIMMTDGGPVSLAQLVVVRHDQTFACK